MARRVLVAAAFLGLLASPAFAQVKVEASATVGWTFSDGVSFTNATPINGYVYDRADPKDSVSYGFTFGVYVTPQAEVEFLWNRQASKLEVTGTGPTLSANMNLDTYHGNFIFNFTEGDRKAYPFVFIGVGATSFGETIFPSRTVPGSTKFSFAVGGGLKAYPSPHVGFKATARWTPTYIKTDGYGWWCDPFWGCYPVGNAQYANQFEFSGGILFKF